MAPPPDDDIGAALSSEDELVNKASKTRIKKRRRLEDSDQESDDPNTNVTFTFHRPDVFKPKRRRLTKEKRSHLTALRPLNKPPPRINKTPREVRQLGVAGIDAEEENRIDALRNPERGYQPNVDKYPRIVATTHGRFGKKPEAGGMGLDVDDDDFANEEEDDLNNLFEASVEPTPSISVFDPDRPAKRSDHLPPLHLTTGANVGGATQASPRVGEWLNNVSSPSKASPMLPPSGIGLNHPPTPIMPSGSLTPISVNVNRLPSVTSSDYGSLSDRPTGHLDHSPTGKSQRPTVADLEASAQEQAEHLRDVYNMKLLILFSGSIDEDYISNTEWIPPETSDINHNDDDESLFLREDEDAYKARKKSAQELYSELHKTVKDLRELREQLKPKPKFWTDESPLRIVKKVPANKYPRLRERRHTATSYELAQKAVWEHNVSGKPPSGPRSQRGPSTGSRTPGEPPKGPRNFYSGGSPAYGSRGRGQFQVYNHGTRRQSEQYTSGGRDSRGGFPSPTHSRGRGRGR